MPKELWAEQRKRNADQKFFAEARKRSPVFFDVNTVLERRRIERERIAARVMLALTVAALFGAPFADHPTFMLCSAVVCFIGFAIICFTSASRAWRQHGGQ